MADQFQYVKLPDGSYGKFAANASDETIRGAIEKDFPDAFNAKPTAPVPAGLSGPQDPEYKPFFSGDEARDEGSGILKAGAGVLGAIANHVPGANAQGVKDLQAYAQPANKGETFGKVAGTALGALPAIYGGGEFAGGVADAVAPALAPAVAPLGRVAGQAALSAGKKLATGALLGAGYEARHKVADLLKEFF